MITTEERQLGRAKNAVMFYLERNLIVPKIYVDANWSGHNVDILAIDRDGVGDVHVVLTFASDCPAEGEALAGYLTDRIDPLVDRVLEIPAQYRYIAAVNLKDGAPLVLPGLPPELLEKSCSPDGLGRIGFLSIDFSASGEPATRSVFKPERFRAKIAKLADEFVQQHEADWEIRA